jgi:hypothetical protein
MASKVFNKEEMDAIRACPYVLDVTHSTIYFAAEFKELFWNALLEERQPRDIVKDLGVDPDILGKTRLSGLTSMIKRDGKAGKGFRDVSAQRLDVKKHIDPEVKIKYLEQQLAYKNQEIEFLKKIALLDKEGSDR